MKKKVHFPFVPFFLLPPILPLFDIFFLFARSEPFYATADRLVDRYSDAPCLHLAEQETRVLPWGAQQAGGRRHGGRFWGAQQAGGRRHGGVLGGSAGQWEETCRGDAGWLSRPVGGDMGGLLFSGALLWKVSLSGDRLQDAAPGLGLETPGRR